MNNRRWLPAAAFGLIAVAVNQSARAADCQLLLTGNDLMQYDQKQLSVPSSCSSVQLTFKHVGTSPVRIMGHDWVLAKSSDVLAIANAGAAAGPNANYLPAGDKRVIAATKVIGGGETTTVEFSTAALQPGSDYTFFCSTPGHNSVMRGKFILAPAPKMVSNQR